MNHPYTSVTPTRPSLTGLGIDIPFLIRGESHITRSQIDWLKSLRLKDPSFFTEPFISIPTQPG